MPHTTSSPLRPDVRSERGAILIFVGLAVLMLTAFCAFVLDYGLMWMSRRQAQNAADAGALAGVIARAFDEPSAAGPLTTASATLAAQANFVYGTPAVPVVTTPPCPAWAGGGNDCVTVQVFRDGTTAGSSALPVFFASLLGVTSQQVRAHAVAMVRQANATDCMKPWYIPDRFTGPNWPSAPFDPAVDTYVPPTAESGATGYTRDDVGMQIVLRLDDWTTPSQYQRLRLGGATGESDYWTAIRECVSGIVAIGDEVDTETGAGSPSGQNDAMDFIFDQDRSAEWDPGTNSVINSCADSGTCSCDPPECANGQGGRISPLIVPVALIDPADVSPGGDDTLTVVNIMTFFLDWRLYDPSERTITAWLVGSRGLSVSTGGGVTAGNGFLVYPTLIQ